MFSPERPGPQPAGYGDGTRLVQRLPKLLPEHQRADLRCGCGVNHRASAPPATRAQARTSSEVRSTTRRRQRAAPRACRPRSAPVAAQPLMMESVASSTSAANDLQVWKSLRSSPVLFRKPSRRPGRYCIFLSRVLISAVSWPMSCLARLASDLFRFDQTGSPDSACWRTAGAGRPASCAKSGKTLPHKGQMSASAAGRSYLL